MGIYVPGAYMNGSKNSDGTYTCTVNASGQSGSYTAATAPIVLPVNTPGYAASAAPTSYDYSSVSAYLEAGFIYLQPGIRGRAASMGGMGGGMPSGTLPGAAASATASASSAVTDGETAQATGLSATTTTTTATTAADTASGGAPWGVTDVKAAVRYYRFNASLLPGDTQNIYTFGMSGGGAQSALVGATGDSELYFAYLESIGAAMTGADGSVLSDAVTGSMCWCPITSLDEADEAYEWNMGQFSASGTRADTSFGSALSDDLAAAYAEYINALQLRKDGAALTLTASADGIYQSGSYYDYILSVIDTSLNNFLADTTFPYTASSGGMQFPGGSNGAGGGAMGGGSASTSGETYATAQDYIDSLNADTTWITYDAATNTASVASVEAFAEHCKNATKGLGAFDELDRGQAENSVFGDGASSSSHFDAVLAKLLTDNASEYAAFSDWDASCAADYTGDLAGTDSLGTSVQTRLNMYNPMYYLCDYYDGYQTSTVAKFWRIRTGIEQSDTALTVEANLALALENTEGVSGVDFATVWGLQHTQAERTGDSTTNFIAWVNDCAAQ